MERASAVTDRRQRDCQQFCVIRFSELTRALD